MTWTSLDDAWDDDPKLLKAVSRVGNDALAVWVRGVTYCNRLLTDGKILGAKLRSFAPAHRRPQHVVDALVDVGKLLALGDDEYMIRDFLDWNESRADVEAKRSKKAEAGRRGGEAKARNASRATANDSSTRLAPASQLLGSTYGGSSTPSPSPSPSASAKQRSPLPPKGGAPASTGGEPEGDPVERVWCAYVGSHQASAGKASRLVLNEPRRRLIRARLKDHPVEQVCAAAAGVFREAWAVERAMTGPEWVFRNAGNVERYAALGAPALVEPASTPESRARGQAAADEVVRERRAALGLTGTGGT